jgi:hypothetical protein
MIVLVCGDRNWTDFNTIDKFLATQSPITTKIVEGDCKGADKISGYLARKRGFEVIAEAAKFDKFGLFAGIIRNSAMIHMYEPDLIVAFHNDIEHSKGTKNMLFQAKKCGIKTLLIKSEDVQTCL